MITRSRHQTLYHTDGSQSERSKFYDAIRILPTTFSYSSENETEQRSQYSDHATGCTVRGLYPDGARNFSCFQIVRAGSGAHPASYSMRNVVVYRESIGRGLNLTTDFNLVTTFRMNGAILLLVGFVSWTGKTYIYSSTSEF